MLKSVDFILKYIFKNFSSSFFATKTTTNNEILSGRDSPIERLKMRDRKKWENI